MKSRVPFYVYWFIILIFGESWIFYLHIMFNIAPQPEGLPVLIISDPQLTDAYSYSQQGMSLALTQYYSDVYMKRSYRAILNLIHPVHVIFLGDLFDGGREWKDGDNFEYELKRFRRIFQLDYKKGIQYHFMAGNHDIGFGEYIIDHSYKRFIERFGPLNALFSLHSNAFILFDSIGLSANKDTHYYKSSVEFLENVTSLQIHNRILFTHVPLWRNESVGCGSRRHQPNIHQHRGYQYQNLIEKELSNLILEKAKPSIIFSGDDHDICVVQHSHETTEVTLPTFSWLQGNSFPGYGVVYVIGQGPPHWRVYSLPVQYYIFIFYGISLFISVFIFGVHLKYLYVGTAYVFYHFFLD